MTLPGHREEPGSTRTWNSAELAELLRLLPLRPHLTSFASQLDEATLNYRRAHPDAGIRKRHEAFTAARDAYQRAYSLTGHWSDEAWGELVAAAEALASALTKPAGVFPDRREASPAAAQPVQRKRYSGPPVSLDEEAIAERAAAAPPPPEGRWVAPRPIPRPPSLPTPAELPLAFGGRLPAAADFPADRLTTNMATLPSMPTRWLWGSRDPLPDGRLIQVIPRDELTLIAAEGGTGKGMNMALFMAVITRGWPFPYMPEDSAEDPGDVIVVAPEDNPITALGPRLDAAGADRTRVHDLTLLPSGERFSLPSSLPVLYRAAACFPKLKTIIIDPVAAAVDFQMTSVYQARAVLEPLVLMAQELAISILVTCHLTADGKVHGSPAVVDTPRYVWKIDYDKQDESIRRWNFHKGNNIAGAQSLQYVIRDDGFGPRAVFIDRESVRSQRLQPMIDAAVAWQKDNAYQITSAQHPALDGQPHAAISAAPEPEPQAGCEHADPSWKTPALCYDCAARQAAGSVPGGPLAGGAALTAVPRSDQLDKAAAALAVTIGEKRPYDTLTSFEKQPYRQMAAAALTGQPQPRSSQ